MSLLKFMPSEASTAAQKVRPANRTPLNADKNGESSSFDAALAAVRKRSASQDTASPPPPRPTTPAKKLDNKASRNPNGASPKSSDNQTPESAPDAQSTATAESSAEDPSPEQGTQDPSTAAKSPDGSEVTATVAQANAAVIPSARTDNAAPFDTPKDVAKVPVQLAENQAPAVRPNALPKPETPTPEASQAADNPDSNPPALTPAAVQSAKLHEKNTNAAHRYVDPQAAGGSDAAPAPAAATPAASMASGAAPSSAGASGVAAAALPDRPLNSPSPDSFLGPTAEYLKNHTVDSTPAETAPAAQEPHATAFPDTFDQVVMGLKGKLDARNGTAEIQLNPPNLGAVHVSVTLDNGTLTAEFQSASNTVRELLKGNMDKLKSALQSQGVAVDRLAVDAPPAAPDAGGAGQNPQASFGSATHDGRSAGQYQQDGRSGQSRSGGEGFARTLHQVQDAPLDLVA